MNWKPASTKQFISLPQDEAGFSAAIERGYMPAFPPEDYDGSIAQWCLCMERHGLPHEYDKLTSLMVTKAIYESVIAECEGGEPSRSAPLKREKHPCLVGCGQTFSPPGGAAQHTRDKHGKAKT